MLDFIFGRTKPSPTSTVRTVSKLPEEIAPYVKEVLKEAQTQYAPSPYNINVALYIYAKNQDDGLQILEQILPYFNPDFNLSITAIPELNIQNDGKIFDVFGREWLDYKSLPYGIYIKGGKKLAKTIVKGFK